MSEVEPLLLAFDVSTPTGSVALARGPGILARRFLLRTGEHASGLVPAIAEALEEANVSRRAIEGIVVGRGPGSFTGVRVGAATARGLARALDCPLWPRSSLAAAAASVDAVVPEEVRELAGEEEPDPAADARPGGEVPEVGGRPLYVLFDARGDRVYAGCYRVADGLDTILGPHASTLPDVLASPLPDEVLFCGAGALRHRARIEKAGHVVLPPPAGVPTAEGLLRVHRWRAQDPPEPEGSRWEPDYVRGSSARQPAGAGGAS